ncbi:LacI family DNA-binding transcriptional regulator [Frigidibacter mobilis]|uniref:LacI family DNA-binding transcriptional regulator n=1 Tax=Frigidibacter mobilis TaxID=1335048 RepID=UPI002FF631C0
MSKLIDLYRPVWKDRHRRRIMRSPTLHDVARSAGVSYSTADRVLNGRGGVAEKSAQRVLRAIEELGYRRDIHAANLSRRRNYRFLPTFSK